MKVTLITAFSGNTDTLQDTIESVLKQSYPRIEHLLVAHAPTPDSLHLVCRYQNQFPGKIRYIIIDNAHYCSALNFGLMKAKGDIVGFLPSNAVFSQPDVIEHIVYEITTLGVSGVYGDFSIKSGKGSLYRSYNFFGLPLLHLGVIPPLPLFYCRAGVYYESGMFNPAYRSAAVFECLLRLFRVYRIRTAFLPIDFITIREGMGIYPKERTIDVLRALKRYHVFSNRLLVWLGQWIQS